MSRNGFEKILSSLQHNDRASEYEDGFQLMIQWKEAWNKNMEDEFSPSWVSALDESMMECINKYCPGFMCVGRNITILEMNVIQSVVHLTRFYSGF